MQPDTASPAASRVDPPHVAVVGSGPAGMVLALELAARGCRVTLVESGGEAASGPIQGLSDAEMATEQTHASMQDAVHRRFGGTSHLWGGRCLPYDPLDFVARGEVRSASWPFTIDELAPYWARACAHADCGLPLFDYAQAVPAEAQRPLTARFVDGDVQSSHLERWSATPVLVERLGVLIRQQPLIECRLGMTVVALESGDAPGAITALSLKASDGEAAQGVHRLQADAFVLACGGVETTRLLLQAQRDGLPLAGAAHLGRYYMGHMSGKIATVQLRGDAGRTHSGFEWSGQHYVRRRFTFTDAALQSHKLLNIALWLDNPLPANPAHRSGILSAAYLALHVPVLRDKLAARAIRNSLLGGTAKPSLLAHLGNLMRSPFGTAAFVVRFLHGRYVAKTRLPGFFVHSPGNRYAVHYHAEQSPYEESRITLGETRDRLGMPRARIDLRFRRSDAESVVAAHALLDAHLREHDIGELQYEYPEEDRVDAAMRQARDGLHQIGTTRMAHGPEDGVADAQGRMFGTTNLYACSSSLFPTSGQANPTLTIMAFAIRQADHLASIHANR